MMPYSQAAVMPGAMMYPSAQQQGPQVTRGPLRTLYAQDALGWPGLENRPPRSHAPSEEMIRSIAEREYWRQKGLDQAAVRQETETESVASSRDTAGELFRAPTNRTFTKRLADPPQDPGYWETELQATRSWFEDRRNRLVQGGSGNTSRCLKYGFAGLTLFLLVAGLVAALATTRDKDPGPSEYASKAILELLGRIPYSPLSMETRSYSSLESKETFTPGRHHSGTSLDPLEAHAIPVNTGNARVAKRSAQMDEPVLPVMTDPFGFGKLTVKPELRLGSAQYEVTDIPEAAKTSSDGLTSVEVFPTRAYPVTLPPKIFSTEEEPRTDFVTIDRTTEGQDKETSTIAPKLVPRTIEKPPSHGPLISILVSLVFLFILILVIQAAKGIGGCATGLSSVISSLRNPYVPQWH